jgi:kojibiose phosphorylase
MPHLKAVIFDLDGVLTDTVELHYQSWMQTLTQYGIPFDRQINEQLGLNRQKSLEVILGSIELAEQDQRAILEEKNRRFLEAVEMIDRTNALPGAERLLQELKAEGILAGVASASRNAQTVLQHLDLLSYFDAVCDSNLVTRSMPAPDVFLQTAHLLEVCPENCAVIEDSEAGVTAARAADMCVIGLRPELRMKNADAVFASLEQVNAGLLKAVHSLWWAYNPHTAHEARTGSELYSYPEG